MTERGKLRAYWNIGPDGHQASGGQGKDRSGSPAAWSAAASALSGRSAGASRSSVRSAGANQVAAPVIRARFGERVGQQREQSYLVHAQQLPPDPIEPPTEALVEADAIFELPGADYFAPTSA